MATTTAAPRPAISLGRTMLNKVPEVTLFFWIIKVLCTTVGETTADYLNDNLGFGLTNTTYATGAVLAVLLLAQFRVRRYVPGIYWAAVAVISVFGTLITDNLTDARGVALTTTTPVFAVALALVFAVWWGVERTLSMHSIVTTRRESFYWLAILFTFALGTAAGDLIAEKADLGYAVSIAIFGGAIALIAAAHYVLKVNGVLTFWLAYILTRPLGASLGDEMSQNSHKYGGLGLGTTGTSYIFLTAILVLVIFLSVTKRDQTPPELVAKDLGAAWPDQPGSTRPGPDQAHVSRSHILVVTDHAEPTEPVLAAIRARAAMALWTSASSSLTPQAPSGTPCTLNAMSRRTRLARRSRGRCRASHRRAEVRLKV